MHDKLFLNVLNIKVQSSSCGRPQAQARFEAGSKPKLVSVGFSQRERVVIPSKAKNALSPSASLRILRHGGCYETARAVRWTYVLSLLEDAEDRNKEEWIEALGRSTHKPRKEYCALQGHSHGVVINLNLFSLKQIPLGWKEHIFHTGSSFNHNSVPEKGQWAGGLSLRSARQPSFLSALNRQESSSRQRTTDWKDDEPRMVLFLITSTNDLLKMQIWYFIKVAVTLLFCTTRCRQTH